MTGQQLRKLAEVAHMTIEASCERHLAQADLASDYITVAADLLDKGELTFALQLCRRAGEVCPSYAGIHSDLGGAS